MTTLAQLREAALALPDVDEGTHVGMLSFSVRGKGFVSVTSDAVVQMQLPDDVAQQALAEHPQSERLVRMGKPIGIRIPLAQINGQALNALVRSAWFARAPKRLAATLVTIDAGVVSTTSDLPAGLGKPATRALLAAGLVTLDAVSTRSTSELLALHGVGPKAVRILSEALAERGITLP